MGVWGLGSMQGMSRKINAFLRDRSGNIIVPAAFALPVLLGVGGLVVEYGNGLADDTRNQRVADLASYAGAIAFQETDSQERMTAAARNVAMLNGIAPENVEVTLENSPENGENRRVRAQIRTQRELLLSKFISPRNELEIFAGAMVEVGGRPGTPGCILALNPTQTGVTLSGGTGITANDCSVSSNNTVTVPCGTYIRTENLNYNSPNPPAVGCSNGLTAPGGGAVTVAKQATPDPLAGHPGIGAAFARFSGFGNLASMVVPVAPTPPAAVSGLPIDFAWDETKTKNQAIALGCTAVKNGSTWVFTCPTTKTQINISALTIGGGLALDFALTSPATTTFNFNNFVETANSGTTRFGSGTFNFVNGLKTQQTTIFGDGVFNFGKQATFTSNTTFGAGTFNFADAMSTAGTTTFGSGTFNFGKQATLNSQTTTFGAGTFNFTKGLHTGGGSTVTFGKGTFKFGQSDNACSGGTRYSLCHSGTTLTFDGPSTFEMWAGFYNNGGSTLRLGSGAGNSFKIGPSSNGSGIEVGGGSTTVMADASLFQVKGHVNSGAGGGSCMVISAAPEHDIDGNLIGAGAVQLGAGVYTVNGYVSFGQGGGARSCNGQNMTVRGIDVSLIISGKNAPTAWPCNGMAFCIGAGYSNVQLTAPTSGPLARLAVAGPQDSTRTSGALFTGGGSGGKVSGAFYFPNGPVEMSGGADLQGGGDPDRCLQLIGSRITLSGGTSTASECIAAVGSEGGTGRITLIR